MWRKISSYSDCSIYIYIVVEKNSTQFRPYFAACNFLTYVVKKIATETQRHGEKHFRGKGALFYFSLCLCGKKIEV